MNKNKKESLKNISLIKNKNDEILNEEVIELSQSNDTSIFIPIKNEDVDEENDKDNDNEESGMLKEN